MRLPVTALTVLALAGAAPALAEPKVTADPSLVASDKALLKDEAKAIEEFQRRLRNEVSFKGGLLIIAPGGDSDSGITVMPATVMWGVDCGDGGIAVTFGTGSGDTDNGAAVQLTSADVGNDACKRIAPAMGQAVLAITKGN